MRQYINIQPALGSLKIVGLCFILHLFFAPSLRAQTIEFDNISLEDGLSQSVVTSIEQDSKGFLWFATQSGLNRYNGKSFSLFKHNPDDTASISNNYVTTLHNVKDKAVMWVGTSSGLNKFNLEQESFQRFFHDPDDQQSLSNNWITSFYEGPNGFLWIGTQKGLNRYNPRTNTFSPITAASKKWDAKYFNIKALSGAHGKIWLGSSAGLLIYDPNTKEFTKPQDERLAQPIFSLFADSTNIWAGSTNGEVFAVDKNLTVDHHFSDKDGLLDANVQSLNRDPKGNLWVGTLEGVSLFDISSGSTLNTLKDNPANPNSLSTPEVRSIFIDHSSVVWVATFEGGINKTNYLNKQFQHFKSTPSNPTGLGSNQVKSFAEDENGNIWIGTSDEGFDKFDPDQNTFTHFPHDPNDPSSPSSNLVRRVAVDSKGYLWVAANGVGLDRYNLNTWSKKTFTPDDRPNSLVHENVWVIEEGPGGFIWFGTYGGGISRYNPQTESFQNLQHQPNQTTSLSNNFITSIYPQSSTHIWIGTQGGLNLYNPQTNKFTVYKHSPDDSTSITEGPITDIHEGPEGDLWITTYGGGVDRFNIADESFTHFRENNGLANDGTYGILEDENGDLWISTNDGISRVTPSSGKIINYSPSQGLQSKEFTYGAYHKSDDGTMYFGGINGFNRFNPNSLSLSTDGPEAVITKFALFNNEVPIGPMKNGRTILDKSISHTSELNLSYKDYVFSFEFAALNYAYPDKNTFAYKMVGLEDKWNQVGNRNYVSYTNMPAGEYTFKVKAANYNGIWSAEPATIKLNVAPPFWQTAWFYVLSILFIIATIFTAYRFRVRQIHERNQKLEQVVEERTQELNEKNEDLQDTLVELEETKDELVDKAHKAGMADIATGVLHNVGNILNSVNTSSAIMEQTLRNSKVEGLQKANALLRENIDNIEEFITENPKGKKLLSYYLKVGALMAEEQQTMLKHNLRLNKQIHLINAVISTQQDYAGAERYIETVSLPAMLESALTLQSGSIDRHDINIEKDLDRSVPKVEGQKAKIIHILVNLIKNAKEAITEAGLDKEPNVAVSLYQDESTVRLSVTANGCGAADDDLNKIFTHGFTTKKEGHGFGLHSCSNYMTEMGGQLTVDSKGINQGATFTLIFPKPS